MESIENSLISKMSQMTTDDREVLIRKFSEIISPRTIPTDAAAFYMDLANWNLSTALSVFYDQNGDLDHMEEAFRLASLSSAIGECTNQLAVSGDHIYLPGEMFLCSWRVTNNGRFAWPAGTRLAFIDGDPIDYEVWEDLNLEASDSGILNMKIFAPLAEGDYKARFQFVTPKSYFFGESLWIVLRVKQQEVTEDIALLATQMENMNGQPNDPCHTHFQNNCTDSDGFSMCPSSPIDPCLANEDYPVIRPIPQQMTTQFQDYVAEPSPPRVPTFSTANSAFVTHSPQPFLGAPDNNANQNDEEMME